MKNETAQASYTRLAADRWNFLDMGQRAAALTLPYLLTRVGHVNGGPLHSPWQSVGAKGVNVLASKMMLSLFPINTTFFKLQINDEELMGLPGVNAEVRSDIDLSLAKMEKIIMEQIADSNDRVMLHSAMKHLVVSGNALVYMAKKNLKVYPLDRFAVARDGNGDVQEIVTMEVVDRELLPSKFQANSPERDVNSPGEDGPKELVTASSTKGQADDAVVYTHVRYIDGQHKWYQECEGMEIPGSRSSAPLKTSPWLPLRFNVVDGESYGRGRVEEFIGDLTSLELLMKSLVEGSAAAAKVVFLVSPSATTKPQSLARADTGAIIQGRPDDVGVVTVGKTADFKTVQEMINSLTQRLSDAFLVLSVRQSERTTASEVQATQQELNEQLGGIYGNLTAELLTPYLNRKLSILQRSKNIPSLPKGLVLPTVVAGLNGIGRGQDRLALIEFMATLAQSMGPEAALRYINPDEYIKRLAASSGIQVLGLVKDQQALQQEKQQAEQQQMQQTLMSQAGQLAKSPMAEQMTQQVAEQQQNGQQPQTPPASPEG
jgi:hypothetical protein